MTDLVGVASNAVASYQRALGTVSNNIANVATEGYSRQEVVLQANPTAKIGNVYLGTGVTVDRVKRQYDSFAELNLRNSTSDLASQEPMVNYANRVIDVMGSDSMGLNSALDKFFNTTRELSADPASSVKRSSFIRDSQGLTSRFSQLSSQLDLVQNETDDAINSYVTEVNNLAKQIAQVNQQMTGKPTAESQPPDLLDQRDLLLKNLSTFAHLNTHFNQNGSVDVSLGPSFTREVIVMANKSTMIGVTFDKKSPEKVNLILDPYGNSQPLTAVTSGKISGMLAFREQILGTSRSSLNLLATQFVKAMNELHQSGIDGYGNPGSALFKIGTATNNAAANLETVFDDPMRVAAASQFRVIENPENTSGVDANIVFKEPVFKGPPSLTSVLGNNALPDAGVPVKITGTSGIGAVATIPNGLQDVSILLSGADESQQLQIFTRDGRQIGGTLLGSPMKDSLVRVENGFNSDATYSSQYLNGTYNPEANPIGNQTNYKDLQVFYGVKAEVGRELQWDMSDADPSQHIPLPSTPLPATLTGYRIPAGQTYLAGDLFKLNGQTLTGDVTASNGAPLQASDFATWINGQAIASTQGISAIADNSLVVRSSQIDFSKTLTLGSREPDNYGGSVYITASNITELIDEVNAQTNITGVMATLNDNGDLILSNESGNDIDILNDDNTLNLNAGTYTGRLSISRTLETGVDTPIELTFADGKPSDLAKLGFSTSVYIKSLPGNDRTKDSKPFGEDLLIFVTGGGSATVSATYTGTPVSAKQSLRQEQLILTFDTATHYTITDKLTGTVVASREFNPSQLEPGVTYLGLEMSFSNKPAAGDIYEINGNQDGTANNENMLQIAALETAPVSSSGKSIGTAYIDQVNDMGNIARQASIAKAALTVVHDQAVSTRDQVSGVSLDNEAADLIRFQQAYQAAAKILQISSQLFESVLQVR